MGHHPVPEGSRSVTWQYLWRPSPGEVRDRWVRRARAEVPRQLQSLGASEIWLYLTEEAPPRLSLIPFRRGLMGLVSIRGASEELGPRALSSLAELGGSWAGYRVIEAQPLPRERPPSTSALGSTGVRSPLVCLLTLFRRKPGLTKKELLARWHGGHTPLSLEIHPFRSYVRCTVEASLVPGSPPWEGIVTEGCATRADLLNPLRLFGGPRRALFNMLRVGRDISSFIDLRTMESYLVTEYALV